MQNVKKFLEVFLLGKKFCEKSIKKVLGAFKYGCQVKYPFLPLWPFWPPLPSGVMCDVLFDVRLRLIVMKDEAQSSDDQMEDGYNREVSRPTVLSALSSKLRIPVEVSGG